MQDARPHGACSVRLVAQHSNFVNCTAGANYGCSSAQQMWASGGCRGQFTCGQPARTTLCAGPWEGRLKCSCIACHEASTNRRSGGALRTHCCADNGAVLSHGNWDAASPENADNASCREQCLRTSGCTHASYSDAPQTCADDLKVMSKGFGRCTLCGACTRRERRWTWHASYTSYAVARASPRGPSSTHPPLPSLARPPPTRRGRVPTLIISGCDARYERAAAVARRALGAGRRRARGG